MPLSSINPATGQQREVYEFAGATEIESALASSAQAAREWSSLAVSQRAEALRAAGGILRERRDESARLITAEMGKLLREARDEVEKCAWVCDYYAEHAAHYLADEVVDTDAGRSYVRCEPLGTLLAIMPWNFPFWQVFRAAVPALAAGNALLLKHAANVTGCALAIEQIFRAAELPASAFQTLLVATDQISGILADPRVHAVTLTGSERAGRAVAKCAGEHLKKCTLELGGSDAFIVLEDAQLDWTVSQALVSRFQNAGQSCIAGKRFIVVDAIADTFVAAFKAAVERLKPGDPLHDTSALAPLARADLRDALHRQVTASLAAGAIAVTGCAPVSGPGYFYAPSILDRVAPGMPAFDEELFGPVASVVRARDEADAVSLANRSRYGLGGSVWTADTARGEAVARRLDCGLAFVNGLVKSDPRLPFGGIKASGYGRELSWQGLREFVNVKSVWMR
jgi:succinate-semialdehyde dehydrogenase/glutarate-semialdehyde dehydrogenase